jgi:hypothetical protein
MSDLSKKEEALLRALNTTNMADSIHEDLSDVVTYVTPTTCPLTRRLGRVDATALLHEWTEEALDGTLSSAAYADGSAPAANAGSVARLSNKIMSIGRRASASELLNATNTVGKRNGMDAFAREVEAKLRDAMRAQEYFAWNGDVTQTSPQQMQGVVAFMASGTNLVVNSGSAAVLAEVKLQEAITASYAGGGEPTAIYCTPLVAQRIASFGEDKIRYVQGGGAGGQGQGSFKYLSPFGYELDVVPVRGDFLGSGSVYVLDEKYIKFADLNGGWKMKELAVTGDVVADRLIKIYTTLEFKYKLAHSRISNVLSVLA